MIVNSFRLFAPHEVRAQKIDFTLSKTDKIAVQIASKVKKRFENTKYYMEAVTGSDEYFCN